MTNWAEECRRLEDEIIDEAVQIAQLSMDARFYDHVNDAFVLISHNDVKSEIEIRESMIRQKAKALVAYRARVATEKKGRTIMYKDGMPFTPA